MLDKLHFKAKGKRENQYYFFHDERLILTTAVPKGDGDIRKGTANEIRSQMLLCYKQFQEAYSCPLRHDDYVRKLQSKGRILTK